jgi:fatty acid desaturase
MMVCIDNNVYDVSEWAQCHPGGYEILANACGSDASAVFHAFHVPHGSSSRALSILQHLPHVANINIKDTNIKDDFQDAFHLLRSQIERDGLYQASPRFYYQLFSWLAVLFLSAIYLTLTASTALSTLCAGVCMGLFFQQCAFLGHDAGHCSVTHDRDTDTLIGIIAGPLLTGISMAWWKKTHNAHHVDTNSISHDPDIQHMPVLAVTDQQFVNGGVFSHYHRRYFTFDSVAKTFISYQQYIFWPAMLLARWNLYIQSIQHTTDVKYLAVFWAWFSCLTLSLPSWRLRFLFLLATHSFAGILHLQIVLSHFSMPVHCGSYPQGFLRQQCCTCMDIHSNWMNDWFYGGLQFQLAHHIFPRIPRHNLRRVQRLIQDMCQKHGVEFKIVGWWEGIFGLFNTLESVATVARHSTADTVLSSSLRRSTADTPGQLNVLYHDCHPPGVDCAQIPGNAQQFSIAANKSQTRQHDRTHAS